MQRLRNRWVATSKRDFRMGGNRQSYYQAYDAYYRSLGRALGWKLDRATGYFVSPEGRMCGINEMEEVLGEHAV